MKIQSIIEDTNIAPSIREIGAVFGFSEKAAHDHLLVLKRKGYLTYEWEKQRTIRILKPMPTFYRATKDTVLVHKPVCIAKDDIVSVVDSKIVALTRAI